METIKLCGDFNFRCSNIKTGDSYPVAQMISGHRTKQSLFLVDSFLQTLVLQTEALAIRYSDTATSSFLAAVYATASPAEEKLARILLAYDATCLATLQNHTAKTPADFTRRHRLAQQHKRLSFHQLYDENLLACNEYAILLQLLLQKMQISSYFVSGSILKHQNGAPRAYRHAWVEAITNNQRYALDAFHPAQYSDSLTGKNFIFTPVRRIKADLEKLDSALTNPENKSVIYFALQPNNLPLVYAMQTFQAGLFLNSHYRL